MTSDGHETSRETGGRELTGRMVFAMFAAGFGVIIAVNVFMAWSAIGTFPGLEVSNSYIASQTFDEKRERQAALGWSAESRLEGDRLILSLRDTEGAPVQPLSVRALIARRTHRRDDIVPELRFNGTDYVAEVDLEPGSWQLRLMLVAADGTEFNQRHNLHARAVAAADG